eukprot:Hpha_TRINITY_DN30735_c0_g1::TRINITY_DN30735_c0_g1_i1::g.28322::m.28322
MSLDVTVPAAVLMYTEDGGSHHIVYSVECRWGERNFRSHRRYREFRDLDQECRSTPCSSSKPCVFVSRKDRAKLPWRYLFGFLRDPRRVRVRRIGLEKYLRSLQVGLCSRHKQIYDDFLLPRAVAMPALNSPDAVRQAEEEGWERTYHLELTPSGLECYSDLDVQYGSSCLLTVRGGSMNVLIQSRVPLRHPAQRRVVGGYCRCFEASFAPHKFPGRCYPPGEDPMDLEAHSEQHEMASLGYDSPRSVEDPVTELQRPLLAAS